MAPVRIGIAYGSPYYLRFYDTAFAELVRRGHRLVLIGPRNGEQKLTEALRDGRSVELRARPAPAAPEIASAARLLRLARDTARFLSPELASADASRERALRRLAWAFSRASRGDDRLATLDLTLTGREEATLNRTFETLERLLPPDEALCSLLRDARVDVVAEISRISLGGEQAELVKAARSVGVPSAVLVYSWDNLTNKGLLHVAPDRLFVWNDVQVEEAVRLHGVRHESIAAVGAPRFDSFFERRPSVPRAELLHEHGLDPASPTILYLGSSGFVAPREPEFVLRWIAALRQAPPPLAGANVLVRPHPGTIGEGAWDSVAGVGVAVAAAEHRGREQDLLDQLTAADAAVGLNTSAEIEAAIVDRPVLTVRAGTEVAPGQGGSIHFGHLLQQNDGFVEVADDLDEHVLQLAAAIADDPLAAARRAFVEAFVRPCGRDRPVGPILADAIERLARARPRRSLLKRR